MVELPGGFCQADRWVARENCEIYIEPPSQTRDLQKEEIPSLRPLLPTRLSSDGMMRFPLREGVAHTADVPSVPSLPTFPSQYGDGSSLQSCRSAALGGCCLISRSIFTFPKLIHIFLLAPHSLDDDSKELPRDRMQRHAPVRGRSLAPRSGFYSGSAIR